MSGNLRAWVRAKAAAEAAKKRKSSPAYSLTSIQLSTRSGGDQIKAAAKVMASPEAKLPSDITQKKAKSNKIVKVEKLESPVEENEDPIINNSKFAVSLSQSEMTIFRPLKDLGYYKWTHLVII